MDSSYFGIFNSSVHFSLFVGLSLMKRARPERSRSTDQSDSPWDDAYGIALLMVSAMFFLALMSYDPGDLPGWAHLVLSDETNAVTHNFIGQVGAIVAG